MATLYKQSETSRRLKKLAERVPGVKYILPSLPEGVEKREEPLSVVTGAGAMGPIALTRNKMIEQLSPLLRKTNFITPQIERQFSNLFDQGQVTVENMLKRIPKGLYDRLGSVFNLGKDPLGPFKKVGGIHIQNYKDIPSRIGLREGERVGTAFHEFGHELFNRLPNEEKKRLISAYRKEERDIYLMLEDVANAYSSYLGGGENTFDLFPPIIQHTIKKYHKLMR